MRFRLLVEGLRLMLGIGELVAGGSWDSRGLFLMGDLDSSLILGVCVKLSRLSLPLKLGGRGTEFVGSITASSVSSSFIVMLSMMVVYQTELLRL